MSLIIEKSNNEIKEEVVVNIKKKRGRKPKPKKEGENVVKIPKKRGRKPKKKVEGEQVKKIPKKRGRKPKKKDPTAKPKIPKKRGRKKKINTYSVKKPQVSNLFDSKNNTLILHLPISSKNIRNESIENKLLRYNELSLPEPYENETNYKIIDNSVLSNDLNNNYAEYQGRIDNDKLNEKYNQNLLKIRENKNENEINKEMKNNTQLSFDENRLVNIRWKFINGNKNNIWPKKVSSCCLWCCHTFDNIPVALPVKYYKEKFYVKDFYCSFNCAASHNFSKKDDGVWERYSLLNLMYKKLNNCEFRKIKLAPPRETLRMFDGYKSIIEFRNDFLILNKEFKILDPPLVSLIPKIEEIRVNNKNKKLFIPLDKTILENAKKSEKLRLERKKPVISNNTLSMFMNLKLN
jgi:hypothetical protein